MFRKNRTAADLPRTGDRVRIERSLRSAYPDRTGLICSVDPSDLYGVYLVEFDDGLRFRYGFQELELIENPLVPGSRLGSAVFRELLRSLL
jgi:hypothetical protein